MLSREEIKKWLLENCVDNAGDLNLDGLDFSDFDGDIYISNMKVKNHLYQAKQKVGGTLSQDHQTVEQHLYQNRQQVEGNLYQEEQSVGKDLSQCYQEVKGNLFQSHQAVEQDLYQNHQAVGADGCIIQDDLKCFSTTIDYKAETDRLIKENYELKGKLEGYETLLLHLAKELKEGKQNDR